jgi:hypothetical protein
MNSFKNLFIKIKRFFKNLPNKKHHLDFWVAVLSIPVLLTVVLTNVINLQNRNVKATPTPTPVQKTVQNPIIIEKTANQALPTNANCIKQIGAISIDDPQEEEVVKNNPVCITISYDDSKYCSVVWSYSINGGDWSSYSNSSPCIYNLPTGQTKFDLKVQSTASQNETTTLTRNFDYEGTSTTTASSSANLQ